MKHKTCKLKTRNRLVSRIVTSSSLVLCLFTILNYISRAYSHLGETRLGTLGQRQYTIITLVRGTEFTNFTTSTKRSQNSLRNFGQLPGVSSVLVFVDHAEACELITTLSNKINCVGVRNDCFHEVYSRPTMGCILRKLVQLATTDLVVFVNGDILLFKGIACAISHADARFDRFVLVGRRIDVKFDPDVPVDADAVWFDKLEKRTHRQGKMHGEYGLDYFAMHKKDVPLDFPEFVTGAWRWDNALLAHLMMNAITVIDGSATITALHQSFHSSSENHELRIGAEYNSALANRFLRNAFLLGKTGISDFITTNYGGQLAFTKIQRVEELEKCILRHGSLAESLLMVFVDEKLLKSEILISLSPEIQIALTRANHVFVTRSAWPADISSHTHLKLCSATHSRYLSNDLEEYSAEIIHKVVKMGFSTTFCSVELLSKGLAATASNRIPLGESLSILLFERGSVISVVADSVGFTYLDHVVHCQKKAKQRFKKRFFYCWLYRFRCQSALTRDLNSCWLS